jgi:hypothetical protein
MQDKILFLRKFPLLYILEPVGTTCFYENCKKFRHNFGAVSFHAEVSRFFLSASIANAFID